MNMENIRFDRLLQLAQHLESGQLGHETFDFGHYNRGGDIGKCGTAGCAIGECPIIWPDEWEFGWEGWPLLKTMSLTNREIRHSGMMFFGLSQSAYCHLFIGDMQNTARFGGIDLHDNATKEQVAANIRAFCDKMSRS